MAKLEIQKSLERNVGQGPDMLEAVTAITDYVDNELVERRCGQIMRDLYVTLCDYKEKVQEGRAAA